MDPKNKFKLKTFLYYLVLEPWTEQVTLPNFRTLNTIFLCISLFLRWKIGVLIGIILLVALQLVDEYKKGDYINWYRFRKYGNFKEALKKVREEKKKNKLVQQETDVELKEEKEEVTLPQEIEDEKI